MSPIYPKARPNPRSPSDIARIEQLYQGEIAFADAQLGQLLDHLQQLGIKDQTIIAVTGDHGESFGEHSDWIHGLKVFETEIRVPLLLRYPPRLPAGLTVGAPTQHVDILPTLLDLTGLSAKQPIQGTSLREAWQEVQALEVRRYRRCDRFCRSW